MTTEQKTRLTYAEEVSSQFKSKLKQADDALKKGKKIVGRLNDEIRRLQATVKEKSAVQKKHEVEYLDLIVEFEEKVKADLKDRAAIIQKVEAGEVRLGDAGARTLTEQEIREAAREKFSKKFDLVLKAVRKVAAEIREMEKQSWQKRRNALMINSQILHRYGVAIDQIQIEFKRFSNPNLEIEHAHVRLKSYDPNEAQFFKCDDLMEIELLAIRSEIREEHLPELFREIDQMRENQFDFDNYQLQISYKPLPIDVLGDTGFVFQSVKRQIPKDKTIMKEL